VVGDVDQSIYAFRGADFTNVGRFEKLFHVCSQTPPLRSGALLFSSACVMYTGLTAAHLTPLIKAPGQNEPERLEPAGQWNLPVATLCEYGVLLRGRLEEREGLSRMFDPEPHERPKVVDSFFMPGGRNTTAWEVSLRASLFFAPPSINFDQTR